jgi:hypothetical protein
MGNVVASYTPPTFRGSWAAVNAFTGKLDAKTSASGTTRTTHSATGAAQALGWGKITTEPLSASGLLSGTVEWMAGVNCSDTTISNFKFKVHIYVSAGDTDTVRGTLLNNFVGTTTFTTVSTGKGDGPVTLSGVNVIRGDRICVEFGEQASFANSQTADWFVGGTGTTDLTSGSTSTSTQPGWIDFVGSDALFVPTPPIPFNRAPIRRASLR